MPEVLQHTKRFQKSIQELERVDADVIGLNEVTQCFLGMLSEEAWVRNNYMLSTVCGGEDLGNTAVARKFGNVLLSRVPFASLRHFEMASGREAVAAIVHTSHDGLQNRTLVTSVHLIAFPTQVAQRASELESLTSRLAIVDEWDLAVVLGDFNFHFETESSSIPDGWTELPAAQGKYTWDMAANPMIRHYLPKVWWGIGWSLLWPVQMRLDRIIVASRNRGSHVDLHASSVKLFADVPVHEGPVREATEPIGILMKLIGFGPALVQHVLSHRRQSWEDYLFPSDHFGLFTDLALISETTVGARM
uniref:Endonuclease/exonuclease/phosphatase domain-containing protein n=1 Tax=Zooxanthella nutricula TaxID=1333877 RepID=A0A7S2MG97_9DINO